MQQYPFGHYAYGANTDNWGIIKGGWFVNAYFATADGKKHVKRIKSHMTEAGAKLFCEALNQSRKTNDAATSESDDLQLFA